MDSLPAPCPLGWFPPLWGSKGRQQPHPTPLRAAGTRALRNCRDFGAQALAWAGGVLGGWRLVAERDTGLHLGEWSLR